MRLTENHLCLISFVLNKITSWTEKWKWTTFQCWSIWHSNFEFSQWSQQVAREEVWNGTSIVPQGMLRLAMWVFQGVLVVGSDTCTWQPRCHPSPQICPVALQSMQGVRAAESSGQWFCRTEVPELMLVFNAGSWKADAVAFTFLQSSTHLELHLATWQL